MHDLSQLEKRHRAMVSARAFARHREREHRRETRMRRHQAVGVAAMVGFLLLIPLIEDLAAYLAMVAALGLALDAFARAVDLRLGHTWGRLYRDPRRVTRFDRWMVGLVATLQPRPATPAEQRVRVLPPLG